MVLDMFRLYHPGPNPCDGYMYIHWGGSNPVCMICSATKTMSCLVCVDHLGLFERPEEQVEEFGANNLLLSTCRLAMQMHTWFLGMQFLSIPCNLDDLQLWSWSPSTSVLHTGRPVHFDLRIPQRTPKPAWQLPGLPWSKARWASQLYKDAIEGQRATCDNERLMNVLARRSFGERNIWSRSETVRYDII